MNKHIAYISLGSNMASSWGQPEANLDKALELLTGLPGIELDAVSALYLTEPQNVKDQPWFANMAARLFCAPYMTSDELLDMLQEIETLMGRRRSEQPEDGVVRYGPRIIDLDILLFDVEQRESGRLVLPHPRLRERAFVLVPLNELEPDLMIPACSSGNTVREILKALPCRIEGNRIYQ